MIIFVAVQSVTLNTKNIVMIFSNCFVARISVQGISPDMGSLDVTMRPWKNSSGLKNLQEKPVGKETETTLPSCC